MSETTSTATSPQTAQPIGLNEPLPNRKEIRGWLTPMANRVTLRPIALLVIDYVILLALISGTVLLGPWWAKLLCGLVAGFWIGRIFIIGHDACHMSLTPHRKLNKWLGRIAFLPSLTPYSLWDVGHNVIHHGYTNLRGTDFVWEPLTKEEFDALSPWQKFIQRVYRSGWGPGIYYGIEIWWKREYFPSAKYMPTRRAIFWKDSLLVTVFAVLWIGALIAGALAVGEPVWMALLFGFAVPFFFWLNMIGFVVYVQHTHVKVAWQKDKATWAKALPFVSTTVHLTFKRHFGAVMHHIHEHTAHHVDMSIPLYRLKEAQERLEELLPGRIVVQPFSWGWYFDTARLTKLYDYERKCWTDFNGQPTSVARADDTVVPQGAGLVEQRS